VCNKYYTMITKMKFAVYCLHALPLGASSASSLANAGSSSDSPKPALSGRSLMRMLAGKKPEFKGRKLNKEEEQSLETGIEDSNNSEALSPPSSSADAEVSNSQEGDIPEESYRHEVGSTSPKPDQQASNDSKIVTSTNDEPSLTEEVSTDSTVKPSTNETNLTKQLEVVKDLVEFIQSGAKEEGKDLDLNLHFKHGELKMFLDESFKLSKEHFLNDYRFNSILESTRDAIGAIKKDCSEKPAWEKLECAAKGLTNIFYKWGMLFSLSAVGIYTLGSVFEPFFSTELY